MAAVFAAHVEDLPGLAELIENRRALGQDHHDEIHEGVYRVSPTPAPEHGAAVTQLTVVLVRELPRHLQVATVNIGIDGQDYRIPDLAVFDPQGSRTSPAFLGMGAARLVVEVLSPGEDETAKFAFYHQWGIVEILTVDYREPFVHLWRRGAGAYESGSGSLETVPTLSVEDDSLHDSTGRLYP